MKRILFILLALLPALAFAQNHPTAIAGTVTDNTTGEALAFVQISVPNSKVGTISDMNGRFDLTVGAADSLVQFRMMGYRPLTIELATLRSSRRMRVKMEPTASTLQTVNITAKRERRERYRRKDNPAVALVKQVIEHKQQNNILSNDHFSRKSFDKLNVCLDQFHPDFQTHLFWKHFPFVEKYIDQAEFDGAEILHFSIDERLQEQEYIHGRMRTLTTATRSDGIDANLKQEGLNEDMSLLFPPINIYDNEVSLMSVHFVSPLSSTLGVAFYHYYITDTVYEEGRRCIELTFVPSSRGNFGFVGSMLVVDDGSYAVQRYSMRVPETVDLNFVRDLNVIQQYERDSTGRYLPTRSDTYGRFYIGKRMRQAYAHQTHLYYDYAFDSLATPLPDSLFKGLATYYTMPNAHKVRRKQWNEQRPMELTLAETFLDSMRYELMRIPSIRYTMRTLEALFTGYVPTCADRDSSKFDFGPIYNFVSHNGLEGTRLRLGGMTTAQLNNRNFADGYIAYGLLDQKIKFDLNLYHTFAPKRRWPKASPVGYLMLHAGYDVESPGLSFDTYDRDNILMWTDQLSPAQYVGSLQLRLRKVWRNHIGIDTWLGAQHITPTPLLNYYRITPTGTERVGDINYGQWSGQISYSTTSNTNNSRSGEGSLLNLTSGSAYFALSHEVGILDGFYYNRSTAFVSSRLWLSAFGYIDLQARGGIVWNQVPMTKLFTPSGNNSDIYSQSAFNTMRPMEFMMDRYAQLHTTYHMKGLILNHLPLIKRLRLREVLGFNILYGGMSQQNLPTPDHPGLYLLPAHAQFLTTTPYMEYSIGIENIFKLMRIDYIRRLSYLDGIVQPWAIKVSLQFTM